LGDNLVVSREDASTKSMRLSFWRPLLLVAGVVSLIAAVALFSVSISRPYIGVSVRFQEPGVWVVSATDYGGLAHAAGIAHGDVVLAVNGESIEEVVTHHGRLPAGGIRELEVIDSAGTKTTVSVAGAAPLREGLYVPISRLILGVAFWVTGIVVYAKRPDQKAALPLYLLGLTVPVGLMAIVATTRWGTWTQTLEVITYVLITGSLLHFFMQFPREKHLVARHPRILYLCYVPGIVPLSLLFLFGQDWLLFDSHVRAPLLGYLGVGALVGVGIVAHSYLRPASPRERQQIKVFLLGVVAGIVPFAALSAVPAALTGRPLVAPQLSILSTAAIPVTLGYAILKYQLLDIRLILRRGTVYAGLVVLITVIYLLMVFGMQRALATSTTASIIGAAILIAILLALVFQQSRHLIYRLVNKLFYGRAYDYRQRLKEFSQSMSAILNLDELSDKLVTIASETMQSRKAALFLADETGDRYCVQMVKGLATSNLDQLELSSGSPVIEYFASTRDVLTVSEIENLASMPGTLKLESEFLNRLAPHIIVPLKNKERLIGFLCLGEKQSGDPYPTEDLELLFTMGRQAAIALENALLHSQLEELVVTDHLTGLYNHRYFHERLTEEMHRARRLGLPLTLIMLDLDMFHSYNEIYGHSAGDEALKDIAQILRNTMRRTDLLFRYGGEEFTILVPGMDPLQAYPMVERAREAIEKHAFYREKGIQGALTLSQGIAGFPLHAADGYALVFCADMALLMAKQSGRNKALIYVPVDEEIAPILQSEKQGEARITNKAPQTAYLSTIYALAAAIDARDHFTYGHSQKVARHALALGKAIGLSDEELGNLRAAALLHDIGKIGITDQILRKKGPLSSAERDEIKKHPAIAQTILGHVPVLAPLLPAIVHHHEAYSGTGYPSGLTGDNIPLAARIIHIADAWDALTSERPYRVVTTKEQALAELQRCSGADFDPRLVEVFYTLEDVGGEWQGEALQ